MYRYAPLSANIDNVTDSTWRQVIAAPGATKSLRIVGGMCALLNGAPVGSYRILIADDSHAIHVNDCSFVLGAQTGNLTDHLVIPEPGIIFPANVGLQAIGFGPVTGDALYTIFYFTDRLS
jgi:hypothetical protein